MVVFFQLPYSHTFWCRSSLRHELNIQKCRSCCERNTQEQIQENYNIQSVTAVSNLSNVKRGGGGGERRKQEDNWYLPAFLFRVYWMFIAVISLTGRRHKGADRFNPSVCGPGTPPSLQAAHSAPPLIYHRHFGDNLRFTFLFCHSLYF